MVGVLAQKWITDEKKKRLDEIKKEIKTHEEAIQELYKEADTIWVKPDCPKCIHKNSPCIPTFGDCTGFVEEK